MANALPCSRAVLSSRPTDAVIFAGSKLLSKNTERDACLKPACCADCAATVSAEVLESTKNN